MLAFDNSNLSNLSRDERIELVTLLEEKARRRNANKTVYGFYRPTGEYGGELVRCLQEQEGAYVEVDLPPTVHLAEKLEPLLVRPRRFNVLLGGRGGSKSIGIGDLCCAFAKDYGDKTLCLREVQNTIEDSVHALLSARIVEHQWANFQVTDKAIRINGDDAFKFRGVSRNVDGVKSAYGFRRSWFEEAQKCSSKSLNAITPTIREADSQLIFSLNPESSADPISQRFIVPFLSQLMRDRIYEDDLHLVIWINYDDNPWHRELESERAYDEQHMSRVEYRHKWHGEFNDEVQNAIITAEMFDASIDAHVKLGFRAEGAVIAAHDPSDLGPDDKGYALRRGSVVLDLRANPDGDVNEGLDWALDLAIAAGADHFVWDADGMGVALKRDVDKALAGKKIEYHPFHGSESPENGKDDYIEAGEYQEGSTAKRRTNRDALANKRAQYYMRLRHRFYQTWQAVTKGKYIDPAEMISLSSSIDCLDQLRAEVCRLPRKPDGNGRVKLYTKDEMKAKFDLPSPNLADALMMSMIEPVGKSEVKRIRAVGWGR